MPPDKPGLADLCEYCANGLSIPECQDTLDYLLDAGMLVHGEDDRYRLSATCA
jgi:hypothetical protein